MEAKPQFLDRVLCALAAALFAALATPCHAQDAAPVAPAPPAVNPVPPPPPISPDPMGPESLGTKRGSRLNGRLFGVEGGRFLFDDIELGRVGVHPAHISGVTFPAPATMFYQTTTRDSVREGRIAWINAETGPHFVFWDNPEGTGQPTRLEPSAFFKMQRDPFKEWRLTGRVGFSLTSTDGNSQQLVYGGDWDFRFAHPWHTAYLLGNGAFAKTRAKRTVQRAYGEASYTFQFLKWAGAFVRESVVHDDFRNLRAGGVTAYGFSASIPMPPGMALTAEANGSHTRNDQKRGLIDKDFAGIGCAIVPSWVVSPLIRFSGYSRYNASLEHFDDFTVRNEAAVHLTPFQGFVVGTAFQHDYDSTPPGTLERNDYRLILSAGYSF